MACPAAGSSALLSAKEPACSHLTTGIARRAVFQVLFQARASRKLTLGFWRDAYFWAWRMGNIYNKRLAFGKRRAGPAGWRFAVTKERRILALRAGVLTG